MHLPEGFVFSPACAMWACYVAGDTIIAFCFSSRTAFSYECLRSPYSNYSSSLLHYKSTGTKTFSRFRVLRVHIALTGVVDVFAFFCARSPSPCPPAHATRHSAPLRLRESIFASCRKRAQPLPDVLQDHLLGGAADGGGGSSISTQRDSVGSREAEAETNVVSV